VITGSVLLVLTPSSTRLNGESGGTHQVSPRGKQIHANKMAPLYPASTICLGIMPSKEGYHRSCLLTSWEWIPKIFCFNSTLFHLSAGNIYIHFCCQVSCLPLSFLFRDPSLAMTTHAPADLFFLTNLLQITRNHSDCEGNPYHVPVHFLPRNFYS